MLSAASGCGRSQNPTYWAGWKITFADGTPLAAGWVSLQPVDPASSTSARGQVQADGTFELTTYTPGDGAAVGEYRVVVVGQLLGDREQQKPGLSQPIDKRFANYETSGLSFVVTNEPKQNQLEITLK
jgi:hypothetical protein